MTTQLLCIPGPTGAGKTSAAISLAQALDGEVINFDSRQVYRDFPVITAQPSEEERAGCPHLLYGFLPTEEKMSAAAYTELALKTIEEVASRGKLPILVGGTGLYMRSVLRPLADIPAIPEDIRRDVQEDCERRGPNALHKDLEKLDPVLAARLHPNDRQRIMRGIEVARGTGKPLSVWQTETVEERDFQVLKQGVGLPLPELTPYLNKRIDVMLEAGAMQEAESAMENNADPKAPGWSGIGCAELLAYLQGRLKYEDALYLWQKNTRAYAKRQLTWFRADKEIHWYRPHLHQDMIDQARAFFGR